MRRETGILSFGAYIPRRRLQRRAIYEANSWFAPNLRNLARGERAIANWDEDVITVAVEAARDALIGIDREIIGSITLASTTAPYADRLNAGVVKEALSLQDVIAAYDIGGSQRAGTSALLQALQGPNAQSHLCVAADIRKALPGSESELLQGDAGAAVVVGEGEPIARFIGARSVTVDFVDHYRAAGQPYDYAWESRWIRDEGYAKLAGAAINEALQALEISGDVIDHAVIGIAAPGAAQAIARAANIPNAAVADANISGIGDAGCALPLLMLCHALERAAPGQRILLAGFGQGVDVLVFETTQALSRLPTRVGVTGGLARGASSSNYLRYLSHRGILPIDRGMRAEIDQKQPGTTLYRNRKTVLGLIGGRCRETGAVQFPKTDIAVGSNKHALGTQEDYPLADRMARVVSLTADHLSYSPDPPLYYGMIDFDGGGRMMVEFTDVVGDELAVGATVRMVFRIKAIDEQRHFKRYFWKAVAAISSGEKPHA